MAFVNRKVNFGRKLNVFRVLKNGLVVALVCFITLTIFNYVSSRENVEYLKLHTSTSRVNGDIIKYYEKRKHWLTSNLGSSLFKNQPIGNKTNRTFVVLVWQYWEWLKRRHLAGHSNGDPLDECSVNNCKFTGDNSKIHSADAVLIHLQRGVLPSLSRRNTSQRWVFLTDESPYNTFSLASPKPNLSAIANVFNWSMTYRSDADVPVPYGRTVPVPNVSIKKDLTPSIPFWKNKQRKVLATVLISHCAVKERMDYIYELQKHIKVDIFGKCSKKKTRSCPGHYRSNCPRINSYLFYLAFENSKCRQYLTEKLFYNAYAKGAIPVVMGPPVTDCEKLLPPLSFLHVDNYASPKELAMEIVNISNNEEYLHMFHKWRHDFQVVNEHGYFGTKSYHLCRLCEALNYNDNETKIYDEDSLKLFLEPKLLCSKSMD